MTAAPIDWEFWFSMPEVRLWQAVALTLDIDPDRIDQSRDYSRDGLGGDDVPNVRLREEFGRRLRSLVEHRTDPGHFSPAAAREGTPANHRVELAQVVAWFEFAGFAPISESLRSRTPGREPSPSSSPPGAAAPGAAAPGATAQDGMQQWQEDQIRRTARSLGYDPMALPPDDPGHRFSVKGEIRARCAKNHPVRMRAAIFDKAWSRMMTRLPKTLRQTGD